MANSKVEIELPVAITINGQAFEGKVEVEADIAEDLQRVASEAQQNGVALPQPQVEEALAPEAAPAVGEPATSETQE
jgi:hypothetical protein